MTDVVLTPNDVLRLLTGRGLSAADQRDPSDDAMEFLLDTLYAWSFAHPHSHLCRSAGGDVFSAGTCTVLDHLVVDVPASVVGELGV